MVALACLGVAGSELLIGPWKVGPLSVGQAYKPFSIAVVAAFAFVARGPLSRHLWHARSMTGFYLVATICMYVLAAGPAPRAFGRQFLYKAPYAWFMAFPGFDAIRVPARFVMLATMCMAVVVAFAFARWSAEHNNWRARSGSRSASGCSRTGGSRSARPSAWQPGGNLGRRRRRRRTASRRSRQRRDGLVSLHSPWCPAFERV